MIMTSKKVCEITGIKHYTLDYLVRTEQIKQPEISSSNQRLYDDEHLEQIKQILNQKKGGNNESI